MYTCRRLIDLSLIAAGKWADAIPQWARQTRDEWEGLERDGRLVLKLDDSSFDAAVLESPELWIVLYHGGPDDLKSSENKVNFLRLATGAILC